VWISSESRFYLRFGVFTVQMQQLDKKQSKIAYGQKVQNASFIKEG